MEKTRHDNSVLQEQDFFHQEVGISNCHSQSSCETELLNLFLEIHVFPLELEKPDRFIFTLLTHDHVLSYFVSDVCVHHASHNY